LKILLFHPARAIEEKGPFRRILPIATYLRKRGHDVTLLMGSNKPSLKIRISRTDDLLKIYLPSTAFMYDKLGYVIRALLSPTFPLFRFDIIHSFWVGQPATALMTLTTRVLRQLSINRTGILVDWDDWYGRGGLGRVHGSLIEFFMTILEEKTLLFADAITVVSEALKHRAISVGVRRDKIHVLPVGANIDAIKPMDVFLARSLLGLDESKTILLYMGNYHGKCVIDMMKALLYVAKEHKNIHLLFVGKIDDYFKSLLKGIVKDAFQITFTGPQPYEKVPIYLGAADILLFPMDDTIFEKARFPTRLGDYLAAGKPIVASAVGEVKRVLEQEKAGLLANPNDVHSFAEKVSSLLNDKALQVILGKNARRAAVERYSWERIIDKLEAIYNGILSEIR
jgi:glycosyltransferase involved in cell wall biosynthesis